MHGLLDALNDPEIRMALDLVGEHDSKVIKRIDENLYGQTC